MNHCVYKNKISVEILLFNGQNQKHFREKLQNNIIVQIVCMQMTALSSDARLPSQPVAASDCYNTQRITALCEKSKFRFFFYSQPGIMQHSNFNFRINIFAL